MAETQESTLGDAGQFWLHDGSALYQLNQVKGFDVPEPGMREQVEDTHLQSGDRRSYKDSFYEDEEFTVTLNCRIGSTTDTVIAAARAARTARPFKAVLPENGVLTTQMEGTVKVLRYNRGRIEAGVLLEATVTLQIVTLGEPVPYVA